MTQTLFSYFLFFSIVYTACEIFYFRIAEALRIIDRPNHRSSHQTLTIRGGGIIFPIAFLTGVMLAPMDGWLYYAIGLIAIAFISFMDDINNVDSKIRFLIHVFVIALLLWQNQPIGGIILLLFFLLFVGFINVYNFMDGINGITSLYSIVTIGTFFWVSHFIGPLFDDIVFVSILSALVVFSFFNIRKTARCFSGDVGAISMAYIVCILMMLAYKSTGSFAWIAFMGVYLIDGVFTIFCRLVRKENIFKAHRSHFYQFLANEKGISHVRISLLYAVIQIIINIFTILCFENQTATLLAILFVFFLIYVIFRLLFEGKYRLFTKY